MLSQLENKLLTTYKEEMIAFLKTNPQFFDEAVELAKADKQPLSWRAAWLLWSCIEVNDERIKKHIEQILASIPDKKDGHQRELIKILMIMDMDEEQEGKLFDICMELWEGIHKNPSVRITAFKFIVKMSKKHPELKNEVLFLTEDHFLETLSPGIKHSINRIMNQNRIGL